MDPNPQAKGETSSPDPLNESADQSIALSTITSSARMTRSQQARNLFSLDMINSARRNTSVYGLYANSPADSIVSPRKQTIRLDVGNGRATQTIRVTVEAEDQDEKEEAEFEKDVKRRLFSQPTTSLPAADATATLTTTTTKRRQTSTSPAKPSSAVKATRAKSNKSRGTTPSASTIATTTKVPLRGLSDDESTREEAAIVATPKPRRGRPRRSGTPMPTADEAAVAVQDSPMRQANTAASSKAQETPVPRRRGRPPRAATPKAPAVDEAESTVDELASVAATPAMLHTVVRWTPRVTPKSAVSTTSVRRSTRTTAAKRSASSAFLLVDSDGESVAESIAESTIESRTNVRPRKRGGRGGPRRQAMTPHEMAVIAERDELAPTTAESASPGPASFTDENQHGYSSPASPAPTMLSSVDLINVRTPARLSETGSCAYSPVIAISADETDEHSASVDKDQTPRAPSEEIGVMSMSAGEQSSIKELWKNDESNIAPAHGDQLNESAATESGDELDDVAGYAASAEDYDGDDLLFYDEAAYAEDVKNSRQDMMQPLTDAVNPRDSAHFAANTEDAIEVTPTRDVPSKSPGSQRHLNSHHSSQRQASSTPALMSTPTPGSSQRRRRRTMPVPPSANAAAESDGEVDVISASAQTNRTVVIDEDMNELQAASSDVQSALGEEEGVTTRRRDFDTIAQGEDFSMIGMESLQASFNWLGAPPSELSEMGEMTSRIVNNSLASLRLQQQPGNDQPAGRQEHNAESPVPVASPKKKAEPLTKIVARKAMLMETQASPKPMEEGSTSVTETTVQTATQGPDEYNDSFSEIPESVLAAVVPETMESVSQQHASLTNNDADNGHPIVDAVPLESAVEEDEHDGAVNNAANEHDAANDDETGANQQQPDADTVSSPPVHQYAPPTHRYVHHLQGTTSVLAPAPARDLAPPARDLAPLFAPRDGRTPPPVSFLSPRFPATHGGSSEQQQVNRLQFPADGIRPSLSPIVRAGRALQSVTSDPPTPKNEAHLRSPFRRSMTRDTQSPVAATASRHNSRTPEPQDPAGDEEYDPEDGVSGNRAASPDYGPRDESEDDQEAASPDYGPRDESKDDQEAVSPQDGPIADPEASSETHQASAVATPAQPRPILAPRGRWSAVANGIRNLVANGAQMLSPRLLGSAAETPVAPPLPAVFSTTATASKRSATDAQLDENQDEILDQKTEAEAGTDDFNDDRSDWSPPRAKRARFNESPAPDDSVQLLQQPQQRDMATPSGRTINSEEASSSRSWRARLFQEEGVAESFVGLVEAESHRGEKHRTDAVTAMASEGNSTDYGSDAIMHMVNDISCEEPEQRAESSVGNAFGDQTLKTGNNEEDVDDIDSVQDDDLDIWAIEAERTTRMTAPVSAFAPAEPASEPVSEPAQKPPSELPASEPISEPASSHTPIASPTTLRDPRVTRLIGSAKKRALAKGKSPRGEDDGGEHPLLDANAGDETPKAVEGQSRRLLDDFFSSPVAVPTILPPTSDANIRANEESRLRTMERFVEHERNREERQRQHSERHKAEEAARRAELARARRYPPAGAGGSLSPLYSSRPTRPMAALLRAKIAAMSLPLVRKGAVAAEEVAAQEESAALDDVVAPEEEEEAELPQQESAASWGTFGFDPNAYDDSSSPLQPEAEQVDKPRPLRRVVRPRRVRLPSRRLFPSAIEQELDAQQQREAVQLAHLQGLTHHQDQRSQQGGEEDEVVDDGNMDQGPYGPYDDISSHGDSSFLTPELKPLPPRWASPTKSCIRPPTKPRQFGRVVEFTSSTRSAVMDEEDLEREAIWQEAQTIGYNGEYYYERDENNVLRKVYAPPMGPSAPGPGPAFMSTILSAVTPANASVVAFPEPVITESEEIEMTDADMVGMDDEEQQEEQPAMLSPSPAHAAPVPQQAAPSPPPPQQPSWTVEDWTALGNLLSAYRTDGGAKFGIRYLPVVRSRASKQMLDKVVRAREHAMLVKGWHLDVVDAFVAQQKRQAGYGPGAAVVPGEAYVLRRLFSLLIGEARRGGVTAR